MNGLLILLPWFSAVLAALVPSNRWRPWLLPMVAAPHLVFCSLAAFRPLTGPGWLQLDALGRWILPLTGLLFLLCAGYSVQYLRHREDRPNRVFCSCLLVLPGSMALVAQAGHFGLMWVGVETLTLATAPLIYFNRTPRSIEATWKYLLVCSTGVAVAMLGTLFLGYSAAQAKLPVSLDIADCLVQAPNLSKPWLRAAFGLLLVGYGAKMGLAPMHSWKPDAYGEAPGVVGALLAGCVTSCAFLALMRAYRVCCAAGEQAFAGGLLIVLGLASMAVAVVFLIGQRDVKRLLAFSSVEHMGILALGLGLGGPALWGALLHVWNNGITKCVMFLCVGNLQRAYGSKNLDDLRGALRRTPWTGGLFLLGFFAVTGSPPFGPFASLYAILSGAFSLNHFIVGGLFLILLLAAFAGMGSAVLPILFGRGAGASQTGWKENVGAIFPPVAALGVVLVLGVHIPEPVRELLAAAVRALEVKP